VLRMGKSTSPQFLPSPGPGDREAGSGLAHLGKVLYLVILRHITSRRLPNFIQISYNNMALRNSFRGEDASLWRGRRTAHLEWYASGNKFYAIDIGPSPSDQL
jgi:hypothetical protein